MPLKIIASIFLLMISAPGVFSQKKGCMDSQAINYDSSAKINDGSCVYPVTSYAPVYICPRLSDTLIESSGLIYFANRFWSINDSGNEPAIYAFDSLNGIITHRTILSGKSNIDWEEITQDDSCMYIGEFGNNLGNRSDLKIYIVKKSDIKLSQPIDTVFANEIKFIFSDQTSFIPNNQNHDFDMEAMCVLNDSIHLFSKDWVDKKTRHYVLAKTSGNYSLAPRESITVDGLITSACSNDKGDIIILGGYQGGNGNSFMWILWDFKDELVFNGNKRKIELVNIFTLGQYEATTFKNQILYLSNEKKFSEAGLWRAEINQWFKPDKTSHVKSSKKELKYNIYQRGSELIIESSSAKSTISIYNSSGMKIFFQTITDQRTTVPIGHLEKGIYTIDINGVTKKILIEP